METYQKLFLLMVITIFMLGVGIVYFPIDNELLMYGITGVAFISGFSIIYVLAKGVIS